MTKFSNCLLLWIKVVPRPVMSFHTGKYQQYDTAAHSSHSWHLWNISGWAIKLPLKSGAESKLPFKWLHFSSLYFPWIPQKYPNTYNQKTPHRSPKNSWQCILHDIPSKLSRVTIRKQDWYVVSTNYLDTQYSINCQVYECVFWTSQ